MNKKYTKPILLLSCGALFFIFAIVLFACSATKKDSSYEFSNGHFVYMFKLKFDTNYLIGMILGAMLLCYAIYVLVSVHKNKVCNKNIANLLLCIATLILCTYFGKIFFEGIIEDKLPYKTVHSYLYSFIIFGILCAYFAINYFESKKKNA